jgi:hypothetical protein
MDSRRLAKVRKYMTYAAGLPDYRQRPDEIASGAARLSGWYRE